MDHHVRRFAEHGRGVTRDRHAPRRVGSVHHVAQVAPRLGRIGIDRADNFDRIFFPHQPHDGRADGADAVLHRSNFLFQSSAPIQIRSEHDKAIARRVQPDLWAKFAAMKKWNRLQPVGFVV